MRLILTKTLLFVLLLALSINSYSQISFEQGYYIDNSGQKIDCEIRILNWAESPTFLEYKMSQNSEPQKATIQSIREFGIDNGTVKYVRKTVAIDRSSTSLDAMSTEIEPHFTDEELFLGVLVEGQANLYEYINGSLIRYFYSKENSDVQQLIFKNYRTAENAVSQNNAFRQQLWDNFKYPGLEIDQIKKIDYRKGDLLKFFISYNAVNGGSVVFKQEKPKMDLFSLSVRPQFNTSSMKITSSPTNSYKTDWGSKMGFALGLEAELLLPISKNRWGVVVEAVYQQYKAEMSSEPNVFSGGELISTVDYKSIELPVSVRHYLFLKEGSKMFIDASAILGFGTKSSRMQFGRTDSFSEPTRLMLDKQSGPNLAFGIGYKYRNRFVLQARYQNKKDLLEEHIDWDGAYQTYTAILGYTLFNK